MTAVMTQIDDRNVFAGPRVPLSDLMQRCATEGFSKTTRLLTYNIKAMSDAPDGVHIIKAHFDKQFHEQAMLLTEVLRSLNLFDPSILNAIYRTPRHILLPGTLAPLAYWNGVTPIRGTVALTSPWMKAYAALRLALRPAQRVLVLGYGYGYVSLAFANIVGPEGEIVTVELHRTLVERGMQLLKYFNITNVKIIHGDALNLPAGPGTFDAIWPTLSVKTIPSAWVSSLNRSGMLGAFIPVAEDEFAANEQLHKLHHDHAGYLQSDWWKSARLVFLPNAHESPSFVMYGLSNPSMARGGDPELDHWYEANLAIEKRVLGLLANRITPALSLPIPRQPDLCDFRCLSASSATPVRVSGLFVPKVPSNEMQHAIN
jgi:protein-L-isoaspartate(D-aspartate) O-methyltransferase